MFEDNTNSLTEKWAPILEGVSDDYTRRMTAQLLENQAKAIVSEKHNIDEALSNDMTTVGKLGTFQKFAFPLVRRVYPELIANSIIGVQPMQGPVSQIFYLGNTRVAHDKAALRQTVFSQYNLTYRGTTASAIGSITGSWTGTGGGGEDTNAKWTAPGEGGTSGLDGDAAASGFDLSNVLQSDEGSPTTTMGGQIAAFPDATSLAGWSVSAGERLQATSIPEIAFHIEQQAVVAKTRKMRALWTLEASQDLRAYHNLDLERELTGLLSKELALEIDRELIEDIRMITYDVTGSFGGFSRPALANENANQFGSTGGQGPFEGVTFTPSAWTYDLNPDDTMQKHLGENPAGGDNNIFIIDFTADAVDFAPQHMGHVYANLLAMLNIASQDIYKTTHRGPGTWLLTSPLIGAFLESAAKLEGGVRDGDAPTNIGGKTITYKGKFAGKYDLYIDPLYPEDEILMGYRGANAMDTGFVFAPYIPLQQLPTITDPESFQPRKGILTRYGKAAISPESRFYRVLRIVGPTSNYLYQPFAKNVGDGQQYS